MACASVIDNINTHTESNSDEELPEPTEQTIGLPKGGKEWEVELYVKQTQEHWPTYGNHILAQFDDDSIVVYQAYEPMIAQFAVDNQRFGGPYFSYSRMSWIKTNFLWMMYRSGWGAKKNQTRILAVRISRSGFEEILASAYTAKLQKSRNITTDKINVRLQWDPDHGPNYNKLSRRAIQLGLKGEILQKYGSEWIVSITDITKFVRQQRKVLDTEGVGQLMTARERVYPVSNTAVSQRIQLDFQELATVVGFT